MEPENEQFEERRITMKKVAAILNGLIVITLGLVVAIAGAGQAFDLALGIVLFLYIRKRRRNQNIVGNSLFKNFI